MNFYLRMLMFGVPLIRVYGKKKSNPKAFTTNAICFTHNSSQILHPLLEDGTSDEISDGKEKDLKKVCISVL